jgi:hypothetical protein
MHGEGLVGGEIDQNGMHGKGGCSYQSVRGRWPSRRSGSGTAALGLGLGDGGAVDQPGGATAVSARAGVS